MLVKPIVDSAKGGDVVSVHFDLTLVITKQNQLFAVDNSVDDYTDFVDCNTLIVKQIKIEIT